MRRFTHYTVIANCSSCAVLRLSSSCSRRKPCIHIGLRRNMRSSMQQELVAAATLAWVWQTNVNDLTRQLERLLCSPYRAIEWRTDKVIDFRDLNVPQIAERLVRWDSRHPDTVFQDGFLPRAVDCTDAAMSLKQYVPPSSSGRLATTRGATGYASNFSKCCLGLEGTLAVSHRTVSHALPT